jgi:heat-inducible transcriptional repressor
MPTGVRQPLVAPDLPERVQRLLSALVREYIEHGEPVSSHWLAGHAGCAVSSATVRNVLARLEGQGFVRQPHTSAGRVPTDRGYRYFVDALLTSRRPGRPPEDVEKRLRQAGSTAEVLSQASHELSRVSHHVGFVMAAPSEGRLQRIEFVPLDKVRVLVIVVSTSGQVAHKVVPFEGPITRDELIQAGNYLTVEFAGLTIAEARARVVDEMQAERVVYDALLARILALASTTLEKLPADDFVAVTGTHTLVEQGLTDEALPTLRSLLSMIEEKDRLVRLLTAFIDTPGLTVVIGSEHPAADLQQFSLVVQTYWDGSRSGALGIIGPTRMRYSRAIAAVDSVSHAVSRVLASD